jgi:hypothetical protein
MALTANPARCDEGYAHFTGADERGAYEAVTLPRPNLPAGVVELSRSFPARKWAAPFCKEWTDGCVECSGSALESEILCRDRKGAACVPSPVQCAEVDLQIAPLYCSGLIADCESIRFDMLPNGSRFVADGNQCDSATYKGQMVGVYHPPDDWKCETFQQRTQECARDGGADETAVCRQEANAVARSVHDIMRKMLHESDGLVQ